MKGYIHVIASSIRNELEDLAKLEGVFTIVDLIDGACESSESSLKTRSKLTKSNPVTLTIKLETVGEEG